MNIENYNDLAKLFPKTLQVTYDDEGEPRPAFSHRGMAIVDPTISDCSRFTVAPAEYGLTQEQADALQALNKLADDAAEAALNAGALAIQKKLQIMSGDFASRHFSDDEDRRSLKAIFLEYAIEEIEWSRPDTDSTGEADG